jgi:hypothetical protein
MMMIRVVVDMFAVSSGPGDPAGTVPVAEDRDLARAAGGDTGRLP